MNTTAPSPAAADQPAKPRLHFKLPTFRVGFQKQMDALKAYAVLSENGTKPVHYTRISEMIKIHEANVSSMNPFFLEIGLILKASNGYLPSAAVLDYNRARSWNPDTAALKLAPVIGQTWFGQELTQRLQFRELSEDEAIQVLADVSNAGPETKPQLRVLIEFCEATKIIERANGQLRLPPIVGTPIIETESTRIETEALPPCPVPLPQPQSSAPQSAPSVAPARDTHGVGGVAFDVSINVSMAEMKDWSPERITAFFTGIAQVLAAKNQSS